MSGPCGTSFVPSISKNSRTPFTDTCMAWSPEKMWSGRLLVCELTLNHTAQNQRRIRNLSHNSGVLPLSMCGAFRSRRFRRQGKMSSKLHRLSGAVAIAMTLTFSAQTFAQSDDGDPEMQIQRLEEQLRKLTGQNEELAHQNQVLQDRLRSLQGGAQPAAGGPPVAAQQPAVAQQPIAALPPPNPAYRQPPPKPGYEQPQIAAPAPIYQE